MLSEDHRATRGARTRLRVARASTQNCFVFNVFEWFLHCIQAWFLVFSSVHSFMLYAHFLRSSFPFFCTNKKFIIQICIVGKKSYQMRVLSGQADRREQIWVWQRASWYVHGPVSKALARHTLMWSRSRRTCHFFFFTHCNFKCAGGHGCHCHVFAFCGCSYFSLLLWSTGEGLLESIYLQGGMVGFDLRVLSLFLFIYLVFCCINDETCLLVTLYLSGFQDIGIWQGLCTPFWYLGRYCNSRNTSWPMCLYVSSFGLRICHGSISNFFFMLSETTKFVHSYVARGLPQFTP